MHYRSLRIFGALLLAVFAGSAELRAQVAVIGDLVHEREVSQGESYEGTILIRNETEDFQEVRIYQTDYLFYADGTNVYGEPGSHARSNARWIAYSPNVVTIPPQQSLPVTYSVRVPEDETDGRAGTYWSMVMIEGIPPMSAAADEQDDRQRLGLRTTIRYGVQIISHMTGTGERSVSFSNTKLLAVDEDEKALQVDLINDGTRSVRPRVWVELYDADGSLTGRFEGHRHRIYPGTSVRNRVNLGQVATGTYRALVFVDAGDDDVFGAQYTLEF